MTRLLDPSAFPVPDVELIDDDGEPLESDWHRLEMNLLIDTVVAMMAGRTDYFVGGNMFIYFSEEQARKRDFRGPDFFFLRGRPLEPPRRYWAIWKEEGKYPDVIVELTSPSTTKEDHTVKKDVYEKTFRTPDYFIYDIFEDRLEGWRLVDRKYQPITANERGWLWCEQLGAWLGAWEGKFQGKHFTYLRLYDTDGNLILTEAEESRRRAALERERAEAERERANSERERADSERQRADSERERADSERHRAESAEAEIARLKAQLEQLQKPQN